METKNVNEALMRNAAILSQHSEREDEMMPGEAAQLPQVDQVKEIVRLAKSIIFTDYFYRRQPEEQIRQYAQGPRVRQLAGQTQLHLLILQIRGYELERSGIVGE